MNKKTPTPAVSVLSVMEKKKFYRVNDLREALSNDEITYTKVYNALMQYQKQGMVSKRADGCWSLTGRKTPKVIARKSPVKKTNFKTAMFQEVLSKIQKQKPLNKLEALFLDENKHRITLS